MRAGKILVVDDEPAFCNVLREFLVGKGYGVLEAYDGDEAVVLYERERPDVVLLDVRMPGKDGIETLRELRAVDPQVSVIMVTAVRDEDSREKSLAEGAFDFITKPLNLIYLGSVLKTKIGLNEGRK